MLSWLYSWWYTPHQAARNAPEGVDIKKFIENKTVECSKSMITKDQIEEVLLRLNKVEVNKDSPTFTHSSPLMNEFNQVFAMGYENYFIERRKRQLKKHT